MPPVEPTVVATTDSDNWTMVAAGIAYKLASQTLPDGGFAEARVIRFDPAQVVVKVHYDPTSPAYAAQWGDRLPDADVIVNGGFFAPDDQALGLVISDGHSYGVSFQRYGGMFQVAADGAMRVRSLAAEPYWGEPLLQGVQGFPMLVKNGGMRSPQSDGLDARSFRTVIAQDADGWIVVGVFRTLISLADVQDWLLVSDLGIQIAFGLDGGRSSALLVRMADQQITLPSFDQLPTVIAVYSR